MSTTYTIQAMDDTHELAAEIVRDLSFPNCIELIGDVGTGKTTLTKSIVQQLGSDSDVQSPSFNLFFVYELHDGRLVHHYDFYRLADPGIMQYELDESVRDDKALTIVEWADTVEDILPGNRIIVKLAFRADGSRMAEVSR